MYKLFKQSYEKTFRRQKTKTKGRKHIYSHTFCKLPERNIKEQSHE